MRKSFWFVIFACLSPMVAWAQRDTVALDSVLVTVSRRGNGLVATSPVQELDASAMLHRGIQTVSDALKHLSGITVRDYGGAGGMKTVSVRGIGSKHTGVVYDGLTLTDCQTGDIDLSRYSLDNMGVLRLVVGDGDDIFQPARNQASAATLYMETLQTRRPFTAKGQLTVGSWGTVNPSLFIGGRNAAGWTYNVMGDYLYSDNDYPFTLHNVNQTTREHRQNSRLHGGHAEANARWQWNPANSLKAKIYYYDTDRQLPGIVHLYTADNDEQLRDRNAFGQMQWMSALSNQLSLQVNGKFNWSSSDYRRGTASGSIVSEAYWQREYYASAALLYTPLNWLSLDYSADYAFANLNSTLDDSGSLTPGQAPISNRPSRHTFLQSASAKLNVQRLTVIARLLQSNYINEVKSGEATAGNAHRWSPSVSLSWQPFAGEQLRLRAFWKSIFRMPTFNELYYYHLGSTSLRPEKANQWNVGLTWDSGRRLPSGLAIQVTLDGYVVNVDDKIISVPYNMFVWRTVNLTSSRTYGLDATLTAQWQLALRHRLELTANYTLQCAQDRSNPEASTYKYQLPYTPRNTVGASLTWMNPWANLVVSFDGMDERWTTTTHAEGTRMGGYGEMDLSAWRTFTLGRCSLLARFGVSNLTDRQYEIVARYPMPGRSWRATLAVRF